MSTIFEKIINREIPAKIEFEDDLCIVIHDIEPKAPMHLLIIPKKVIPRIAAIKADQTKLMGHLLYVASMIASKTSSNCAGGFRIVINNGNDAGETVPHMHVHLLGGRKLKWPPG